MDYLNRAIALRERLTDLRRRLHVCPEIGFDLPQTRGIICETLSREKIPFSLIGRGAIVGHLGPKEGKTVLLRADCDALPLTEETDLPFRSPNGAMHACGHDLHTAALLGAAILLKEDEARLPHGIRLLFQPAEELLEGAKDVLEAGVCDGVSEAYMLHVTVGTGLPLGTVILPPEGAVAPSADYFSVEIQGKGCHGADPAAGRDPLAAAARLLLSLEHLTAREIPSSQKAVLTVGCLGGGDAYNVIPHRATLKGSLRCHEEALRHSLRKRVEEMTRGVALTHGVSASVSFPVGVPSLCNDGALRQKAESRLSEVLNDRFLSVREASGIGGSEDFAVISRRVPSLMLAIAAGDSQNPLHHPKVVFDEGCLPYGAAAYATLATL